VALGLLGPPKMQGVQPHPAVGEGEIGIKLERVPGFDHRAFDALGEPHDQAEHGMSLGVLGGERKRLGRIPLRRGKARRAVLGVEVGRGQERVHEGGPDQRVDVLGLDPQRLRKESLSARKLGRIVASV
jgi:hypothetical protein